MPAAEKESITPGMHCDETGGKLCGNVGFAAGNHSAHSANRHSLTDRPLLGNLGTGHWPGRKEKNLCLPVVSISACSWFLC